jgi:glycosyltransferase involved in cell wall biosynthesis
MKVYKVSKEEDERDYGALYERCRNTEGVQYIGSLAQPELASALKKVSVLSYPNTFAETSCIAVMEAMAAGCRIVTSELGALPETTAGFGRLVPMGNTQEGYVRRFIEETVGVLRQAAESPRETEQLLASQVAYANAMLSWKARAEEWVQWLSTLPSLRRAQAAGGFGSCSFEIRG